MTPIPAVVAVSVIGAALFLVAGFLLAKLRSAPAGTAPQPLPAPALPQDDGEIRSLREQLSAAQAKVQQLGDESSAQAQAKAQLEA